MAFEIRKDIPLRSFQTEVKKLWRERVNAGQLRGMVIMPTGCHAPGQRVITCSMERKLVQDIKVGDRLLGADGLERNVLSLHNGQDQMFWINPSRGNPWAVNAGHIMSLVKISCPAMIFDVALREYLAWPEWRKSMYFLCRAAGAASENRISDFTVEPGGTGEYFGFEVDGDHRYLLDDFTVTHNSGKTLTSIAIASEFGRTVFLVHRDNLVEQTHKAAAKFAEGNISLGIVKAEQDELWAEDFLVASIQTVSRPNRLEALIASQDKYGPIKLLIHDECHRAAAPSSVRILDAFPDVPTFGVTATGERSDQKGLAPIFGPKPIYTLSLDAAIDEGWLVDYKSERVKIETLDLGNVRVNPETGDYDLSDLEKECARADLAQAVAKKIATVIRGGREHCMVFCASVNQSERTAMFLQKQEGIDAIHLDANSPKYVRDEAIAKFERGQIKAICNVGLYTEGTDIPCIDCVVNAAPTKSRVAYIQRCGRGLRPCPPKKEDLLILDIVGAHEAHGMQTADALTEDTAPRKNGNKDAVPPLNLGRTRDVEFGLVLATAEASRTGIAAKNKKRKRRAKWLVILEERVFALPAGEHGALVMVREPGTDDTWMGFRLPEDAWTYDEARRIMHKPAPRALCSGVVEDRARKLGVFGLSNESAKWRDAEPSPKQVDMFTRRGMVPPKTRGEASDFVTVEKLRNIFRGLDVGKGMFA